MDYRTRHQNLPEMDGFLRNRNSDLKDEMMDPAKYTADRMERLRSVLMNRKQVRQVPQPTEELPEIGEVDEEEQDEAPAEERPAGRVNLRSDMFRNLHLYQSPYGNWIRRSPLHSPLLRRMTTLWDTETPGGQREDGELPEVPISQVQNRRDRKVPYEPEPQDPYTFPATDNSVRNARS